MLRPFQTVHYRHHGYLSYHWCTDVKLHILIDLLILYSFTIFFSQLKWPGHLYTFTVVSGLNSMLGCLDSILGLLIWREGRGKTPEVSAIKNMFLEVVLLRMFISLFQLITYI